MAAGSLSQALAPALAVAGGLLLVTGAAKLRRPDAAGTALTRALHPRAGLLARPLGLAEVVVGAAALALPGRTSALAAAALYAGFCLFLVRALRLAVPLESCGCAGARETPPGFVHLLLAAALALLAGAAAAVPPPSLPASLAAAPLLGVPLGAGVAAGVVLAHAALTDLPGALASYRPERRAG
jgi:hypothetical protein